MVTQNAIKKKLTEAIFISIILLTFCHLSVFAQSDKKKDDNQPKIEKKFKGMFRDSLDNKFDVSKWMTDLHGVLPLPSIITEPAIGYGLNLALVFFHPTKHSIDKSGERTKQLALPSMTVAGGLYTANGTWGAYGGHYGSYLDDRLRVAVFTGW